MHVSKWFPLGGEDWFQTATLQSPSAISRLHGFLFSVRYTWLQCIPTLLNNPNCIFLLQQAIIFVCRIQKLVHNYGYNVRYERCHSGPSGTLY
jgi:hypothetical protein